MKKWLIVGVVALIVLVIALPKFGESMGWDLTRIQATNKALTPAEVDITAGESVYFYNSSGQNGLTICLGRNGVCQTGASGPGELQHRGLTLRVNETHSVQFSNTGSFPVTSPQLRVNALVVVEQPENNDSSDGGGGSNSSAGGSSGGGGDYNGGFGGSGGSNAGDNGTDENEDGAGGSSGGGDDGGDG